MADRWMKGRWVVALVLSLGILAGASTSHADVSEIADATDRSDSPTDIASISHSHSEGNALLRHTIRFDGEPESVSEVVSIFFRYRNKRGTRVKRELQVRTNPDGGLYGVLRSRSGSAKAIARVWMDDGSTLMVEFPKDALRPIRRKTYRWYVWSILGAGEFDNPCSGEETGPPVCRDRAPSEGAIIHHL